MEELQDDAIGWANYSPTAHLAEIARVSELIANPARAAKVMAFGLRPLGRMDLDPYCHPISLDGPWAPKAADFSSEPILIDTATGWRFFIDPVRQDLIFDVEGSNNNMEATELLSMASLKRSPFAFDSYNIPAFHRHSTADRLRIVRPLDLEAHNSNDLKQHMDRLEDLFCGQLRCKRLWFRGQRQEYLLPRDKTLSSHLYGAPLPSLTPSLDRFAKANPHLRSFGFAHAGPNRSWKKPFLIWLMRENAHWFARDDRFLPLLADILGSEDDARFSELLHKIQYSPIEIGEPPHLDWPDEVDDLRQWFFVRMKRRELAITLQQYGYYTSLLDLTCNIDVALYFTQARMRAGVMRCEPPDVGRLIYVFAESRGDFYHHGRELFWGSEGWAGNPPPRLFRQHAGFIKGATHRIRNFYGIMVIARIWLRANEPSTSLIDSDLFPSEVDDLLLRTLRDSKPVLEGLY